MKIHARINSNEPNSPLCGYRNARRYDTLPLGSVVSPKEYRKVSDECRCQLCDDKFLIVRNRQRREKGLAPVSSPFEGLL
jgi:hypothetical protein